MKTFFYSLFLLVVVSACSTKEGNFTLTGKVDGLKKGTLYLQQLNDTILENIDSIKVHGDNNFYFSHELKEPQMLFLYLDKIDGQRHDDIIEFFAEPGEMSIHTNLENFAVDARINGSKNQEKLEEYRKMIRRFNSQHLDLIKENFDAQKANDEEALLATQQKYNKWLRRKYLYSVNFAINHKEHEIAPYIAISEVFDANISYLDTIYTSLSKPIRKSRYGKELKKLIKEREKLEKLDKKVKKQ